MQEILWILVVQKSTAHFPKPAWSCYRPKLSKRLNIYNQKIKLIFVKLNQTINYEQSDFPLTSSKDK